MFFAGVTYNFITVAMVICLFIGSFAFEGGIKELYVFFFNGSEISVEIVENNEINTESQEKKLLQQKKCEEIIEPNLTQLSPPVIKQLSPYEDNNHSVCLVRNLSLRAPPYYSVI